VAGARVQKLNDQTQQTQAPNPISKQINIEIYVAMTDITPSEVLTSHTS